MKHDPNLHEGGCACGAVRYRISGPIDSVAHCHCNDCRKASGGTLMTWAMVDKDAFTYSQGTPALRQSSEHSVREFCPDCGTQLQFRAIEESQRVDVALGSLDCAPYHPADRHIWTQSRVSWLKLDAQLPEYPRETGST